MSHFSLNLPSSDTLWYTPSPMDPHPHSHHQKPLPLFYHPSFKYDDVSPPDQCDTTTTTTTTTTTSSSSTIDHEYMFEKPLTPSDVGKLNRLVIPKQHAEKYFPLSSSTTTASAADGGATPGGGGMLLGFEDESGKCWKFRYSYWNSSQSYVLTKGWSRYVKEKKLDAGDVVLFQRHRFENDRFFIGWRRRGSNPVHSNHNVNNNNNNNNNHTVPVHNYGSSHAHAFNAASLQHPIPSFSPYRRDPLHATGTEVRQKGRKSMGRKVRLFGVNLECQIDEDEEEEQQVVALEEDEEIMSQTSDGSSLSSQGQGQGQGQHTPTFSVGPNAYNYFDYVGYSPNNNTSYNNNHMDMNFPQDVNQMRNRLR